ncbi:MAG: alpha/beta fold hydrolase [Terracidiphilus sp.]|jgi:pimeloyl-ACP methyl ester carboxylesterase
MNAQHQVLNFGIALISRTLMLRDRLLRRVPPPLPMDASISVSRHTFPSGRNRIDAVFVTPDAKDLKANLLLCHGIGETVEHWFIVQQLLASCGVASLMFNYSGYGRSTGFFTACQVELDAISAFNYLREIATPLPISVLGMSLGSGIATAIRPQVPAHRLVLCAAFTSLRKGAISIALPKSLGFVVPDIWDSENALRTSETPILIVHGTRDRLFPVRMAEELKAACAAPVELIVIPGLAHNGPFYRPQLSYWKLIAERII